MTCEFRTADGRISLTMAFVLSNGEVDQLVSPFIQFNLSASNIILLTDSIKVSNSNLRDIITTKLASCNETTENEAFKGLIGEYQTYCEGLSAFQSVLSEIASFNTRLATDTEI